MFENEMYEAVCKTMGKFLVIATWTYRKVWLSFKLLWQYQRICKLHEINVWITYWTYTVQISGIDALDKLFILHTQIMNKTVLPLQ
jgi:citrate synthase